MWRKRFQIIVALMGFTLLIASLSFAAGTYVAEHPGGAVASRLPFYDASMNVAHVPPSAGVPDGLEEQFAVFWDVWRIVENDFFGETDRQAMIQGAIKGMVDALGDPYTQYIDPQQNAIMREDDSGGFEGIGATVDMIDGRLTIISPLKGSPADRAGLKAGDVVLEVDGRPVKDMDLIEAVSLVRGPKDSTVTLTIQRKGVPEPFKVSIVRAKIPLISVDGRMLSDQIGYLAIRSFSGRTVQELDKHLAELEAEGAKALILDLRGNPGGFLDAAVETVSRFVDQGPALWWENADGSSYPIEVKPRHTFEGPVVVLIDEGSASASEIVAGALQDYHRATLIGTQSFGKGSVQNVHQLRDGGSVRVTTAHWLTPDRHEINGVGLMPDIYVAQDDTHPELDIQLSFAHRVLRNRIGVPRHTPFFK
ncbi:MAG: S41 family peptidase [Chloroflexi bacterium]|nr:MAG: S41 family peptidase [Chloroflexota bacterium]